MGIETSADHGGAESSFTSAIIAIEELAKVDPSVSVLCDVHNTLVNTVFRTYATQAQKDKYLPLLAESKLGSFCLSESGSGSDAFALQTKAEKKGDHYVINGSKMWITNSYEAEVFLVFANVDPSKGYKGITCFIVEKDMGIQIAKKEEKLGIRASSTCTLNFDDVKVPAENVLGGEEAVGKGYRVAIEILNEGASLRLPLPWAVDPNPFSFLYRLNRPNRYCSSDDRSRPRGVRQSRPVHLPAQAIRQANRRVPRDGLPICRGRY